MSVQRQEPEKGADTQTAKIIRFPSPFPLQTSPNPQPSLLHPQPPPTPPSILPSLNTKYPDITQGTLVYINTREGALEERWEREIEESERYAAFLIGLAEKSPKPPAATVSKKKSPETPLPDTFVLTDRMLAWCEEQGYDADFIESSTEYFCDWARAHDHRYADWVAVWRNILRSRWAEKGKGRRA
jgi:hypothetical protein